MDSYSDEDEVPQLPRRSPRKKQRTDPLFGEEEEEDKREISTVSVVTPDQVVVGDEDDNELFSSEEEGEKTVNRVLFGNNDDEDLFSVGEEEEQTTTPLQEDGIFRMPPKHSTRYVSSKNTCELNDTVEVVKECHDIFMLREMFPGKVSILKAHS